MVSSRSRVRRETPQERVPEWPPAAHGWYLLALPRVPQVSQDALDALIFIDEGNDAHGFMTGRAEQRV